MLTTARLIAFVAARDPARARHFYRDLLGLNLVREEALALVFDASGTTLRVTIVAEPVVAPYTVIGWQVADAAAVARALQQAGVPLLGYPGLEPDPHGIWTSPTGAKIVWFADPDGNVLSATEFPNQE